MEIQKFTQEQMEELRLKEKDHPIKQRWFKHKEKGHYQFQISLLEIREFEEVR